MRLFVDLAIKHRASTTPGRKTFVTDHAQYRSGLGAIVDALLGFSRRMIGVTFLSSL